MSFHNPELLSKYDAIICLKKTILLKKFVSKNSWTILLKISSLISDIVPIPQIIVPDPDIAMQIQPTKTQMPEALNFTRVSDSIEYIPLQENVTAGQSVHGPAIEMVEPDPSTVASVEALEEGFDNLAMELNEDVSNTVSAPPVSHQGQKESVFIRLSNRIKVSPIILLLMLAANFYFG